MNVKDTNGKNGFTIIEVVLVLAIAGLIFLMVFIALPALQRNQRDTQRSNDLSRVATALNKYQSNNRGRLPNDAAAWGAQDETGAATGFINNYLKSGGDDFADPSGKPYTFAVADATVPTGVDATTTALDTVRIYYTTEATCNGESVRTGQGNRKVAFRLPLEGGGVSCISN